MIDEKLIDRIRKLQAKANDKATTEEEALAFSAKVAQLLAQHNLDEAALDAPEEEDIEEDFIQNYKTGDKWTQMVSDGVAKLYFCDTYLLIRKDLQKTKIVFVGKKHNVEVAKSMANYLINTIGRLASDYSYSPLAAAQPGYTQGKARRGFERGAAARIWTRLHVLYHEQAKAKEPERKPEAGADRPGSPTNLPALYEDEEKLLQEYMKKKEIPDGRASRMDIDGRHSYEGMRAADGISLQGQVEGSTTKALK